MRISFVALLLGLCLASPAHCGVHVGVGIVDEIEGESSVLASVAWLTPHRHPWEFALARIDDRNGAIRTPGTTWLSASKRLTWKHWFVQSGLAWADVDNEVLSGHFQFQTGAGYDFGRTSVSVRHLSNANTSGRNRGETFLLLDVAL